MGMVFCNFLEADEEGYLCRHIYRLRDQKIKTVAEFQRLNFKVLAVGYSFNDIEMLLSADQGILFNPSADVLKAHPELPVVRTHDELKAKIVEIMKGNVEPPPKRQKLSP